MVATRTEQVHRHAAGLDMQPAETILRYLAEAQVEAASVVASATQLDRARPPLARPKRCAAAAASPMPRPAAPGLMAIADALELPGTFGIARDRIDILLAEGAANLLHSAGRPGGRRDAGRARRRQRGIGKGDCLIALSASGTTPYAVAALEGCEGSRRDDDRHRQQ